MRIALAAAILAATMGTAPAAAQYYPPTLAQDPSAEQDIGWQLDEIYETIERARRSGRFSGPEARALHREGQRLFDRFQYARRDGLDRWEFRELDDGARALRERIERRLRFGDWRDGRDDGFREPRDDSVWPDRNAEDRGWQDEAPWRDEPVEDPGRYDDEEDWSTAPSEDWEQRDEPASEGPSPGVPDDDWWLPPAERESIETRPGDRPPGSGGGA